jgi:hypothetical protein
MSRDPGLFLQDILDAAAKVFPRLNRSAEFGLQCSVESSIPFLKRAYI